MSTSNCEFAPSPRTSGGDFQCTEEELFESFMEIINDQDIQGLDNLPERPSSLKVDEDTNGNENNNIDSDDSERTETETINKGCLENELNLNDNYNEPQEVTISTQSDGSLNCACKDTSIDHNDTGVSQNNVSLIQRDNELYQKDDCDQSQSFLTEQKDAKIDKEIISDENKDSSQNQRSEASNDVNHHTSLSTEDTNGENLGRKNEATNEITGELCEEDQKSSGEILSDATLVPQDVPSDENELQSIEDDIQEGIRMANQVCDEIQEILTKRMSCSSDGILSDKNLDSPGIATITEPADTINQQSADVDTSYGEERNKTDNQMPGIVEISQGDNSSSTFICLQEVSDNSDDVNERKKSISDSLESSDDSLASETKGMAVSPTDAKGNINWEILNTAFENPDTDDDEKGIYEASGSYGGFGLMLDDDSTDKLVEDDNRGRLISQSSTRSEYEFQEEYKKQHSNDSLDRKKDGVLCSGYLLKLGGTGITPKNWRKRWCVLRHDGCLYYYKTPKDNVPSGIVVLTNYIVSRGSEFHKKNCLKISKGGGRTYFFCTESPDDMLRWMEALRKAADVIDEGTNFEIRREIIHNVAIPALSIKNPDCHGYLRKQGAKNRNSWKRRYCVLKNGCLFYYREMADTTALGVAKLHGYKLEEVTFSARRSGFRALPPSSDMRTFSFVADNEFDKKRWIPCLEQSIQSSSNSS